MRIVHFSDIHMGSCCQSAKALFDKRILGMSNYLIRRRPHMHEEYVKHAIQLIPELKPDCVICSGDITCIGSRAEFQKALRLLQPLAAVPEFDFLYVPGNHDAYIKDRESRTALEDAFSQLNRKRWRLDQLPVRLQLGPVDLLLINECRPTPIWGSFGVIDGSTAAGLNNWLLETRSKGVVRALLGHFPTRRENGQMLARRRRLRGGETIRQALMRGSLDLSFCGHIHDPYINRFENGALEICSGSLTTHGHINVVDIDNSGNITQKWRNVRLPHEL